MESQHQLGGGFRFHLPLAGDSSGAAGDKQCPCHADQAFTAIGVAAGLIAAFALTRGMATMLVGVKATDPMTFATVAVVFFLISAIACWLPARRAANLDPTMALREE